MSHSPTEPAYGERHPGEVENCDVCGPTYRTLAEELREEYVKVNALLNEIGDPSKPIPGVTSIFLRAAAAIDTIPGLRGALKETERVLTRMTTTDDWPPPRLAPRLARLVTIVRQALGPGGMK